MKRIAILLTATTCLLSACQKEQPLERGNSTKSASSQNSQLKKASKQEPKVSQEGNSGTAEVASSTPVTTDSATSASDSPTSATNQAGEGRTSSDQAAKASSKQEANSKATNADTKPTNSPSNSHPQATNQPTASDAYFNGSYYSVQGKYGEVIIVNKKHPLSPTYNPGEQPAASGAFWQLIADMRAQGFAISDAYSGFRSYDYQANLYQQYVNRDGQAAADRYSARPGYSEHQTGLAYDLLDANGALLQDPQASQWLAQHAHQYGFVVRYLPGKEGVTGYMPESWHIRYIGQEATDIYQSGLTLEEYYGVSGGGY